MTKLKVNGTEHTVKSSPDTPLLYVLRNELGVMTPKFGCGMAQCGACSVLLDGAEIRSCITPIAALAGKEVTTVEGLPARWAKQRKLPAKRCAGHAPPRAGSLDRGTGATVRHLSVRHDDQGHRTTGGESHSDGRSDQGGADHLGTVAALVPVRQLCRDHGWCAPCRTPHDGRWEMTAPDAVSIYGATLSRRSFLAAGGALVVALNLKHDRRMRTLRAMRSMRRSPAPGLKFTQTTHC